MTPPTAPWQNDATSMPDDDQLEGELRFFLFASLALLCWIGVGILLVSL